MDFSLEYTQEQLEFQIEVREWLEANAPRDIAPLIDPAQISYPDWKKRRAFAMELGRKGWYAPTFPRKYGGGGLSVGHRIVLEQELDRFDFGLPPHYDLGIQLVAPAITAIGSEEQKKQFLPPILKGEVVTWQLFTEADAGSDLASLKTEALRDGDDYVVNGQKIFVGAYHTGDQFWLLTRTDPKGPRHKNLSMFLAPSNLPGISIHPLNLIAAGGDPRRSPGIKQIISFDNVRVPASNLIGEENKGWQVANATLDVEHGGAGDIMGNRMVATFLEYVHNNPHLAQKVNADPILADVVVQVYLKGEIQRLLGLRNYWMNHAKKRMTYEGAQFSLYSKVFGLWLAGEIQKVIGPYAITADPQWAPAEGSYEVQQRAAIVTSPGGTPEIQKVIMARMLKIGREEDGAKR